MMRLSLYFFLLFSPVLVSKAAAQTVQVSGEFGICFGDNPPTTFSLIGSDNGRKIYSDGSGDMLEIRFRNGRWEFFFNDGTGDVLYTNAFASAPDPPDSGTSPWQITSVGNNVCAETITVSGTGTQTTLGGDPCDNAGGDTDGDGVCDPQDRCAGFDDNDNPDNDELPSGCDPNPNDFDGVEVDATCVRSTGTLLFVIDGTDATGRHTYRNYNFNPVSNVRLTFNQVAGQWEVRNTVTNDLIYSNTFASRPAPPASSANPWTKASFCPDVPTFFGLGVQTDLGCTMPMFSVATSNSACGSGGGITPTAQNPSANDRFSITGPVNQNNTTGQFTNLPAGTYTVTLSDDNFPSGACAASSMVTVSDPVPAYDDCATPQTVTPDDGLTGNNAVFLQTCGATPGSATAASCSANNTGGDIWAAFTATQIAHEFRIFGLQSAGSAVANPRLLVSVYGGRCGGLVELACGEFMSNMEVLKVPGLVIGTTYLVRMQSVSNTDRLEFSLSVQTDPILPLSLLSFTGTTLAKRNALSWETSYEAEVAGHRVERSVNGYENWQTIVELPSVGNSQRLKRYEAADLHPLSRAYYRLRSTDLDGTRYFSSMILLDRSQLSDASSELVAYPNPTSERVTLSFPELSAQGEVRVLDYRGGVVAVHPIAAGTTATTLDFSQLSAGLYFLTVGKRSVRLMKR